MEELIPMTLFVILGVIFIGLFYFRFRARQELQETIRLAISSGQNLNSDLLEDLVASLTPKNADLRRGVVSIALALGFMLFGQIVGEEDAVRPMMAIAMFPLLVGLAYFGLWFFGQKR